MTQQQDSSRNQQRTATELLAAYADGQRMFAHWDLAGADLKNTTLKDANFFRANLKGADLSGADLTRCNFSQATLSGAILRGANTSQAYFDGAVTFGADLTDVITDQPTARETATSAPPVLPAAQPVTTPATTPGPQPVTLSVPSPRFCVYCGASMAAEGSFCAACGKQQPDVAAAVTPSATQTSVARPEAAQLANSAPPATQPRPTPSIAAIRPATQQPSHASRQTPEHARQVITGSWVFTGIVGSFVALILFISAVTPDRQYDYVTGTYDTGSAPTGLLLLIPVAYFAAWALFWGWGPVWRGWKQMMRGVGCPVVIAPAAFFLLFFLIIGAIALVYGSLGGFGLYSEAKRTAQGLA